MKKIVCGIILCFLISGVVVFASASYLASNIEYKGRMLDEVLDDLYDKSDECSSTGEWLSFNIVSLIPIMSGDSTPSGLIEYSSYYPYRDPYHAFNGEAVNLGNANTFWTTSTTNNEWISYTWGSNVTINYISFAIMNQTGLTIQYKKDNQWVDLKTFDIIDSSGTVRREEIAVNSINTNAIKFQYVNGSYGFLSEVKVKGTTS